MTDQLQRTDRLEAATTQIADFGALSQHIDPLKLQTAVASLTGAEAGHVSGQTNSKVEPAPDGTWARFEATTAEGVKDFVPGLKHAVMDEGGAMLENAAISAAIGFGGKVILSETGALGRIASIGMGAYFAVSSLTPVVSAYKTGITTGDTKLAGRQLGDAMGGAVANLPVAVGSYWAGSRLGSGLMGLESMRGFAAWKESKLAPINESLSNVFSSGKTTPRSLGEGSGTAGHEELTVGQKRAMAPGHEGAKVGQTVTGPRPAVPPAEGEPLFSLQQQLALRLKRTLGETAGSVPATPGTLAESTTGALETLIGRIKGQKLSAAVGKIDAPPAPAQPGFEVVLSASGAETTAHIGFLQALEDKHVPVTSIIGASGGSLAATFYANGYSAAEMKTIFLSRDFRSPSASVLADCMHMMDPWNLWPYALDMKPWLQDLVKKYDLKPQPNLRIVAADSITHEPTVFEGTDYDLPTALAASTAATPAMGLKPVRYNGRTLVDGFYYHPIPAALAHQPPAIVSKIGFTTEPPSQVLSPWDFFMHMKEMLGSAENARKYPDPPGHIIAETGMRDVGMTTFGLSTDALQALIDHGYQAATARLEQPDAVAAIKSRVGTGDAPAPTAAK